LLLIYETSSPKKRGQVKNDVGILRDFPKFKGFELQIEVGKIRFSRTVLAYLSIV